MSTARSLFHHAPLFVGPDELAMAYTLESGGCRPTSQRSRLRSGALRADQMQLQCSPTVTAVLGLGDIGPEAAMPVMEGGAVLFKQFAGVDAYPVCRRADR